MGKHGNGTELDQKWGDTSIIDHKWGNMRRVRLADDNSWALLETLKAWSADAVTTKAGTPELAHLRLPETLPCDFLLPSRGVSVPKSSPRQDRERETETFFR